MKGTWTLVVWAAAVLVAGGLPCAAGEEGGGCEQACEAGCAPQCSACPNQWFSLESLLWWRDPRIGTRPLVIDDQTGGALLSANDIGTEFEPGMRLTLGFRRECCPGIEFSYLGLSEDTTETSVISRWSEIIRLPGDLGLASNVFYHSDRIRFRYQWRLQGAEINLWDCCSVCPCTCCCEDGCGGGCDNGCASGCGRFLQARTVEWFVGFRYLYLGENLDLDGQRSEQGGMETGDYWVGTRNNLFGTQVGGRLRGGNFGRLGWELVGKAGLFGNAARQEQYVLDYPDFYLREPSWTSGGNVAFVGELGISATYQLNDVFDVKAGYNLMWLDGVALAPNQLDFTFVSTSGTRLDTGSLLLHGVNVGLEARW